jgi:rubrerythrin
MDIYEFAMKMEKDGENYYRELAKMTENTGLRNIFTMLANAEVVHHNTFKKMKENEKVEAAVTKILPEVKNIFEKIREEEKDPDIHITQTALYKKAQEIEKESMDFYLKHADDMNDPYQKEIFIRIAGEEKKHYFILEEIVNFVSRPETWLENPEWYHMEEY